jgi:hypothetical protein
MDFMTLERNCTLLLTGVLSVSVAACVADDDGPAETASEATSSDDATSDETASSGPSTTGTSTTGTSTTSDPCDTDECDPDTGTETGTETGDPCIPDGDDCDEETACCGGLECGPGGYCAPPYGCGQIGDDCPKGACCDDLVCDEDFVCQPVGCVGDGELCGGVAGVPCCAGFTCDKESFTCNPGA